MLTRHRRWLTAAGIAAFVAAVVVALTLMHAPVSSGQPSSTRTSSSPSFLIAFSANGPKPRTITRKTCGHMPHAVAVRVNTAIILTCSAHGPLRIAGPGLAMAFHFRKIPTVWVLCVHRPGVARGTVGRYVFTVHTR